MECFGCGEGIFGVHLGGVFTLVGLDGSLKEQTIVSFQELTRATNLS